MLEETGYMGGLKSFTINISEQQLTDKVTYVTADNYAEINDAVSGQYYNFEFSYIVNKTRKQGSLQTCECTANIDELLYTPTNYSIVEKKKKNSSTNIGEEEEEEEDEEKYESANTHLNKIANILRVGLQTYFTDFFSTMELTQKNVTIANLISELFGWTARIPNYMVNFFLRGNTLYVVQRSMEPNRIDITNTRHTVPVVEREIERVTWGSSPDSKTTVTKKIPGISYTWKEKVESEDKKSKFTYNEDNLIKTKEVRNSDGSRVETTYFYKKVDGANFLYLEREERFEKYGDNNPEVTETYYTSLGQGQRSASVYRDGEYVGSSTGSTSGDDSASNYITKKAWLREPKEVSSETTIVGNPLIDTSFPLAYDEDLEDVTQALKALNREIRETVIMDIYDFEHIIDFTDKIVYEGREYHLQSNRIEITERITNKQSITMVKWGWW